MIKVAEILLKSPALERVPGVVTLNWLCQILCSAFGCLSCLINARMCIVPAILDEEHLSYFISGNPLIQLSHDSAQVKRFVVVQPFDLCEFAIPTDFHVSVDSVEHHLGIIWFLAFLLVEIKLIFRKRIGTTYHAGKKIDFRKLPELLPAPFMIHFTMRLHTRVVFHIMNCDSLSTTRANRMGGRNSVSKLTKHTGLLVTVLEILEYFNILIELSPVCCKSHSTSTFEFYVSKQDELVQHILRICFVEDLPVFDHLA